MADQVDFSAPEYRLNVNVLANLLALAERMANSPDRVPAWYCNDFSACYRVAREAVMIQCCPWRLAQCTEIRHGKLQFIEGH